MIVKTNECALGLYCVYLNIYGKKLMDFGILRAG